MFRTVLLGLVVALAAANVALTQTAFGQSALSIDIVEVQPLTTDETITIKNTSAAAIDLGGWRVAVGRQRPLGHHFRFPERCFVPVDGIVRVHSGPAQLGQTHGACGQDQIDLVWQTGFALPNDVGIVEVSNSDNVLQAVIEYPAPYRADNVQFSNGEVVLAGTLTLPNAPGPHPVVVLISGSGAQDRDETLAGFPVFRVIADHLSRRGVAVLRYDDRGVGGSSGIEINATLSDRADDVRSAIELLKRHPEIDAARIGLVGHSEGGMVAPMVAAGNPDVAFIVMLASLGISGDELLLAQSELILRTEGAPQGVIEAQLNILQLIFNAIRTDTEAAWEAVEARLGELGLPPTAVEQQLAVAQSPWYRSFVMFNPEPYFTQLTVPALALFGALDVQVPAELNLGGMRRLFAQTSHKGVTYRILERANHLFQHANTGSINEYAELPKRFVSGFLELIGDWIVAEVETLARK